MIATLKTPHHCKRHSTNTHRNSEWQKKGDISQKGSGREHTAPRWPHQTRTLGSTADCRIHTHNTKLAASAHCFAQVLSITLAASCTRWAFKKGFNNLLSTYTTQNECEFKRSPSPGKWSELANDQDYERQTQAAHRPALIDIDIMPPVYVHTIWSDQRTLRSWCVRSRFGFLCFVIIYVHSWMFSRAMHFAVDNHI